MRPLYNGRMGRVGRARREQSVLIVLNGAKELIGVFLGPFLVAYFIQTSRESLADLSIYYIFSYLMVELIGIVIYSLIRRKFRLGMFRLGVILNFVYVMAIVILKDGIIDHLALIGLLNGFSTGAYWMPYNLFMANKVKNEERIKYGAKMRMVSYVISVLSPVMLGGLITVSNYEMTAIVILVISVVQIALSFVLKLDVTEMGESSGERKGDTERLWRAVKEVGREKSVRKCLTADFFNGLTVSGGVLGTLQTVLVFGAFKTNFNLGLVTTIGIILSAVVVQVYAFSRKKMALNRGLLIFGALPFLAIILLLVTDSVVATLIYYFCYVAVAEVLDLTQETNLFNLSNDFKGGRYQLAILVLREFALNFGRIVGYGAVLLAVVLGGDTALMAVLLGLTAGMFVFACFAMRSSGTNGELREDEVVELGALGED